ncbi:hypothetical protein HELRODRAFT_178671 [Helobdella robusta]|uniref:Uncharacterized protein n=1 Tax=Helobdella robusta TaxID=6412 RepID=T1FDJ6_HELRO|nr:hypothetical protein HELRODRAFT_178671 [Helobdella robusta]ESN96871.1 hypothetical protein HELRODRAFT_178671 [Helobdella robusta]
MHSIRLMSVLTCSKLSPERTSLRFLTRNNKFLLAVRQYKSEYFWSENTNCLNTIYNSLCVTHVTYCSLVWASAYRTRTNPIKTLMKRALSNQLPSSFNGYYKPTQSTRFVQSVASNKSKTNIMFSHVYCVEQRIWNKLLKRGFLNLILIFFL